MKTIRFELLMSPADRAAFDAAREKTGQSLAEYILTAARERTDSRK